MAIDTTKKISKVTLDNVDIPVGGIEQNEVISRETLPTASESSPDFVQTDDGLVYKKSTGSDENITYSYEEVGSGGDSVLQSKYNVGSMRATKFLCGSRWMPKKWQGLSVVWGDAVWTDGINIYYLYAGQVKMVFDKINNKWINKEWNIDLYGTSANGQDIWTDGINIYLGCQWGENYVLNRETGDWETKTWNGTTAGIRGRGIWTDGTNIYYSAGTMKYVLDIETSTWTAKTWTGGVEFMNGEYIWTDGTNIYYSNGADQYVLDIETSTWTAKTWAGLNSFYGENIWTNGTNIYYSNGTNQYVLDIETSTWSEKTWTGLNSFYGKNIWTDGTNIYYSNGTNNYVLMTDLKPKKLLY